MAHVSYANAVGCLMYAMICTRPDIAHVVSVISKFMAIWGKNTGAQQSAYFGI